MVFVYNILQLFRCYRFPFSLKKFKISKRRWTDSLDEENHVKLNLISSIDRNGCKKRTREFESPLKERLRPRVLDGTPNFEVLYSCFGTSNVKGFGKLIDFTKINSTQPRVFVSASDETVSFTCISTTLTSQGWVKGTDTSLPTRIKNHFSFYGEGRRHGSGLETSDYRRFETSRPRQSVKRWEEEVDRTQRVCSNKELPMGNKIYRMSVGSYHFVKT